MTDTNIINVEHLHHMSRLMRDLFDELIPAYLQTCESHLQKITDAIAAEDFATLERMFHSMKSSSRNVGAAGLSELAEELETLAREQQLDAIRHSLQPFKRSYANVAAALRGFKLNA